MEWQEHIPRRPWSPDEFEQGNLTGRGISTSYLPIRSNHARLREPSDDTSQLDEVDLGVPVERDLQWQTTPLPPSTYAPSRSAHSVSRPSHHTDDFERDSSNADISKFPPWSRHWFEDPITPSKSRPVFFEGKGYAHSESILPWSGNAEFMNPNFQPSSASVSAPTISGSTKAKRIKMLEREFASSPSNGTRLLSDDAIGSVDSRGRLITVGPRKRTAVRIGQGLAALIAGIASIYPALFIKLPSSSVPPPAYRVGTYILYIFSVLTLLIQLYIFLFRQHCSCCGGRGNKDASDPFTQGEMMMLPVQTMGTGDSKSKKNNKSKRKSGMGKGGPGGEVQVNLIIDPRMLNPPSCGVDGPLSEMETVDSRPMAPGWGTSHRGYQPTRRSHWQGLAMERAWTVARSHLKKIVMYDITMAILWCVEFGLLIKGPRCPPGHFSGWCDGFNLATASAVFLVVLYVLSLFFDVRDLMASKVSPRQRT